jgi:predicted nucleic acid-binding protein
VVVTVGLDTTLLVAFVSPWHERHDDARRALIGVFRSESRVVVPLHALIEAFSVLSRLPGARRLTPEDALSLLRAAFAARTVVLTGDQRGWELLDRAVAAGVRGGGIHDFEILDSLAAAGATQLLTLDPEDFRRFGDRGVEIVEP